MKRKEEIREAASNSYPIIKGGDDKFIQGAEWADNNPSEDHIAAYLGKKGWPLSTYGIPTYEQATKMMMEYYEYKKKQWIDEACEWLKNNVPNYFGHSEVYPYIDDFRKVVEKL
jgi:hypothetical protein